MGDKCLSYESEIPFDSIESAQEYLRLLSQVVLEAEQAVQNDLNAGGDAKRLEALRLVLYNLEKLSQRLKASSRILNDLRTLRRLLFQERRPKTFRVVPCPESERSEVPMLHREGL